MFTQDKPLTFSRRVQKKPLEPDCCWVDVWSVERLLEPAAEAMSPIARALRLFDLYRGPFLDGDNTPSVLVQRDRLRSRFLRVIDQLGQVLESCTDDEAAIKCYQRGIGPTRWLTIFTVASCSVTAN